MKIAVSVGHTLSGADTGAAGYLNESRCTREIGDLVKSKLEGQGHSVILCRIDNASSVNESLKYRVNKANSCNVDLFIEIHLNAGGGTGTETWISGTGGQAEKYARTIVNSIAELGYYNRGVKVGNLYVTRNTNAPAVLIECCFVDSKSDSDRYNADKIASKIVKGITGKEGSVNMGILNSELKPTHYALQDSAVYSTEGKYVGMIYKDEQFQLNWVGSDYSKSVDFAGGNGFIKSGIMSASDKICKIGEKPPKEETPVDPKPEEKNYKVTITCKDKVEAELIKGFLSTAKVEEY